jgi:antitoxin component YwqK of YwqJK toxin-antitoxin module
MDTIPLQEGKAATVDGQIAGRYECWHENGSLAEPVHFRNGIAHGESLAFLLDGSRKARVRFDYGKVIAQEF